MPHYVKYLLCILFGGLMAVAYAPFNAWWFQPFCLAGLFLLVDNEKRTGFILGACFGIGWFGAGMWWVLPGMVNYSKIGWFNAGALYVALLLYLSLFPGLAIAIIVHFRSLTLPSRVPSWMMWGGCAAIWTLFEWLRGNIFTGLPWLLTGYAQSSGPLASLASLGGVLSLSYLATLIAIILAAVINEFEKKTGTKNRNLALIVVVVLCLTGMALEQIEWTQKSGKLSVRLMQGNLSQLEKFSNDGLRQAILTYANLASDSNAELTVMPETAIPLEWNSQPSQLLEMWKEIAKARNTTLLIGSVVSHFEGQRNLTTNSAIAIMPTSSHHSYNYRYDKQHLIPLGEFYPTGTNWLMHLLGPNFSSLTPGVADQSPLQLQEKKIGVSICFEDLFDTEILHRAKDAHMLLSMSNFAWFNGTAAPDQHLQIAQLRAIETGRWVVQAANFGRTAIVDQHGRIRMKLDENAMGVLDGNVDLVVGKTPFMYFGNWPLLFLCVGQIAFMRYLSLR
ncbi:apolipoprotein N-acyltransferase [Undibacterium sp. Dicai25W]|uniref:apolipoprotein N-acyltransferase n=1 Tax=Undibacterium sp. Dicai25W TaxID=3413034 RepID=UPI003BF144C4